MNSEQKDSFDVIVVGAGTAGLSAALSAHEQKSMPRVLILEKAPRALRGGNGRYTGGDLRFTHNGISEIREFLIDLPESQINSADIEPYSADEYYSDLMKASQGLADPFLCELLVQESNPTLRWLDRLGLKWDLFYDMAMKEGDRWKFPHGSPGLSHKDGGEGLVEMLASIAERKGIEIRYETKAAQLLLNDSGRICGVRVRSKEGFRDIQSKSVVLASGGFQANSEMRAKYLGPGWDTIKVRGTRYDTGDGLKMSLAIGAQPTGQWSGCHSTVLSADAPDVEGGLETALYSYLFSITVNENAQRFFDEGEDFQAYTYAKLGRMILAQPGRIAFQIFDTKAVPLLRSGYNNAVPVQAESIEKLAQKLCISPLKLSTTVAEFNKAVQDGVFNPAIKDGKRTEGISPPKSNWARKIDAPPFRAYPVTTGISFTYGGLKINKEAQVLDTEGNPICGLYATGEVMGGFFYYNYCAGSGISRGIVFGRIAGVNAVLSRPEI